MKLTISVCLQLIEIQLPWEKFVGFVFIVQCTAVYCTQWGFSGSLPIFLTDCVSLHKKLRLFSINIERVIKCFVLFHDIFMTFIYIFFCFSDKWAEQDKKIKELLKHMYLQCFSEILGSCSAHSFCYFKKKKTEKCEINCRPSVLRSPTVQ